MLHKIINFILKILFPNSGIEIYSKEDLDKAHKKRIKKLTKAAIKSLKK